METEVNYLFPYFLTFAASAICFGVATCIANATLYRPDSSDIAKRKVWFWVMFVISILLPLGINFVIAQNLNSTTNATYTYFKHACIADAVFAVIFILLGLIVSKTFSTKKVGSWFK